MYDFIISFSYLIASVLFIFGLKGLTHPRTAVRGNFLGACGMLLAVVVTLTDQHIVSYEYIILGLVVGGAIGAVLAIRIEMTSMPEMVALLNGFGGAASIFVAGAALIEGSSLTDSPILQLTIATAASGLIGAVTFWGSLVAFGKLKGLISENAVLFSGQQVINSILALLVLGLSIGVVLNPESFSMYWMLVGVASVLGILLVLPIGGADMPVVVALLNSYSGLAAAATGFVLSNNVLIITGSLVGASGIILTHIMCKAMNRSLTNVLFGVMGPSGEGGQTAD
ncbi:MAG: NAD(P)(+) transhydrogenase (Re/Si-specific) subunit beta, partial [Nitrospirota bacterium]